MSYIAGNSSATVNENMSDLYVFDSAEGSSYENQPYAKILTMSGGAAVTYTNVTLSAGGTATVAQETNFNNVTVFSGGSLRMAWHAVFNGLTIESGGWASNHENYPILSNFTVKAGGKLYLANGDLHGRNNTLAANALGGNIINSSASVDGVLYGVKQQGGAFNYYDIVMSNFTNTNGYTYMNSGCSILTGSAITAGKGFAFVDSAYLENAYVSNGRIWMHSAGVAVSLGGAQTYIKQGSWYHCNCDASNNQDTALYAENGVLYGVTIKNNGRWLRNLTIVSGLTISAPVVSSGGALTVGAGGSGNAITTTANANLYVLNGGKVTDLNLGGGWLTIDGDGKVDGATINTAATAASPVAIKQGVLENYRLVAGTISGYNGAVFSGGAISGGQILLRGTGGGATIRDLTIYAASAIVNEVGNSATNVRVSGGRLYLQVGASGSDIDVFNGAQLQINNASGANIRISSGGIFYINAANTYKIGRASCRERVFGDV